MLALPPVTLDAFGVLANVTFLSVPTFLSAYVPVSVTFIVSPVTPDTDNVLSPLNVNLESYTFSSFRLSL